MHGFLIIGDSVVKCGFYEKEKFGVNETCSRHIAEPLTGCVRDATFANNYKPRIIEKLCDPLQQRVPWKKKSGGKIILRSTNNAVRKNST